MLTEVSPTLFNVVVNGNVRANYLPSHSAAEAFLMTLTESERAAAQIVPITPSGQQILFG